MHQLSRLFTTCSIWALTLALAACTASPAAAPTVAPAASATAQPLPLRNELISSMELVGKAGSFQTPWDATPDPEGTTIYFTAMGEGGAGVFKVSAQGGDPVALALGAPFSSPRGLATSGDGAQLYVADEGANALFVLPAAGGTPVALKGSAGSAPQNLTVVAEGGTEVIYYSGKDPASGQPALLKLNPTEGAPTVVVKGAPLVQPGGIAVTKGGVIYLADRAAGGDGLGAVFRITGGTPKQITTPFRTGDPVVGATLTLDESLLLVSALATDRDSAQVLVIDLNTYQQGLVTKVIEANTGAGGIHRAANVNLFAWADSGAGRPRSGGGVYAIRP